MFKPDSSRPCAGGAGDCTSMYNRATNVLVLIKSHGRRGNKRGFNNCFTSQILPRLLSPAPKLLEIRLEKSFLQRASRLSFALFFKWLIVNVSVCFCLNYFLFPLPFPLPFWYNKGVSGAVPAVFGGVSWLVLCLFRVLVAVLVWLRGLCGVN